MRLALVLPSLLLIANAAAPQRTVPADVMSSFRADADRLYAIVQPACPPALDPARFRPARARTAAMEQRTAGTALGQALNEARMRQTQLAAVIDCVAAPDLSAAESVTMQIEVLDQLLPRMERIVTQYSAEG